MATASTSVSFSQAPYQVRPAFGDTHGLFWDRLGRAGAWWTGVERIAIASETRTAWSCRLCAERNEALSPDAVSGAHDVAASSLPAAAVEAVHRLVTDASRISKPWLDGLYAQGLTDGPYVELVGTVTSVVSIDSFCLALGLALHALPESLAGAASGYRPANLDNDTAFVPMLDADLTGTPEEDLWPATGAPNVYRALSLVPDETRGFLSLSASHYLGGPGVVAAADSALSRPQTELLAARVSVLNECFY